MMKRSLALLLSVALTVGLFAGCGKTDNGTAAVTSASTSTAVATETTVDPTQLAAEITWWNFPNFAPIDDTAGKYEQQIITAFNEKYPNIKVNMEMIDFASGPEKITNAIQGGTAPDVVFDAPGRIIQYGKDGVLADVNSMFTDEFKKDVNNEKIINACKANDNYYMYPISSAPFLMAFNKQMLEKHGLLNMINLEGDRTWTVDQYKALITALKDKGEKGAVIFCVSQGGDQGPRAYVANLAGTPITNDTLTEYTINSQGGVDALQFIADSVKNGLLLNGSAQDGTASIEEFNSGRVSHAILYSPGIYNNNKAKMDFEPIFVPYPTPAGKEAKLEYLIDGFCVFNNDNADKIEASKLLIDFICNDPTWGPKNVVQTATFPVRESFGNLYQGNENMTYLSSLTKFYGTYYNTIDGFAEMRTFWFPMMQSVLVGDADAKTAIDNFATKANESIKNAKK